MSNRKRVNISVDSYTHERLRQLKEKYGYKSVCQLVVAFAHILIDRLEEVGRRKYDLPEDDGAYIDNMFDELGHVQRTPDGTVPVRHNNREPK